MRPSARFLKLFLGLVLFALLLATTRWIANGIHFSLPKSFYTLEMFWWALSFGLLLIAAYDTALAHRRPPLQIARKHSDNVAIGRNYQITLELTHQYRHPPKIMLHDHYPTICNTLAETSTVVLKRGQRSIVSYELTPNLRGEHLFGKTDVLIPGPLGLCEKRWQIGTESRFRVYPNFELLAELATISSQQNRTQLGIRQQQRRGEGMEFHQLREFRQGDSLRQIDWKASSRKNKLISREYQDEKDQQIIFMLDCSRRMRSMCGELSFFDHALHAMLILGQNALRAGDAVGILSFGAGYRWQKPLKSIGAINTLLNHVYDIYPTSQAPDFADATQQLILRQRRRALVIFLTNLDQADLQDLYPAIRILQSRHLVLVANLQEPILADLQRTHVESFTDALRYCGATELFHRQQEVAHRLKQSGVIAFNSQPKDLARNLFAEYLSVKHNQRL
ncbi:Conserved hypothetical protein [gamma proteobacterium HdN1]|nr:Conserved hypothetical protein [gamma proteobacterium HdN1]